MQSLIDTKVPPTMILSIITRVLSYALIFSLLSTSLYLLIINFSLSSGAPNAPSLIIASYILSQTASLSSSILFTSSFQALQICTSTIALSSFIVILILMFTDDADEILLEDQTLNLLALTEFFVLSVLVLISTLTQTSQAKSETTFEGNDSEVEGIETLPLLQQQKQSYSKPNEITNKHKHKTGILRILSVAIPHISYLYLGCISLLIRLPFSLSMPHFVATTLAAVAKGDFDAAKESVVLLIAAGTVDSVLDFFCVYFFGMCQLNVVKTVRLNLFSKLITSEITFFDTTTIGELTSRLTSDTSEMSSDLTWFFRFSIEATVRITGIITYMFIRSPNLAALAVTVIPLVAILNKWNGDWLCENAKRVQTALAEANQVANEALGCIRTVVAFGTEDVEQVKFCDKVQTHYELNRMQVIAQGVYYMVVSTFLVNTITQGFFLLYGSYLVEYDGLDVGILLAFMLYQGQLQEYTLQIFQSYTALIKSSGAGEKVFGMMDREISAPGVGSEENVELIEEERKTNKSALNCSEGAGAVIVFDNVTFSYPSRAGVVLDSVSLSLEFDGSTSNKVFALVGGSGAGKSSIVSLITRLYEPTSGKIYFNGIDVTTIPVQSLRRQIGYVSQDPVLFSGTILDNIRYGAKNVTREDAIEAARIANAHGFITSFKNGYDTIVGERAVQLSGGQKARLAIARAIIRKPSLLILDEATSSLDALSEGIVLDALEGLKESGITVIVVAHRLYTVRNAKVIFVVKGGKVVERGNHDELMESRGEYKIMVEGQRKNEDGVGLIQDV